MSETAETGRAKRLQLTFGEAHRLYKWLEQNRGMVVTQPSDKIVAEKAISDLGLTKINEGHIERARIELNIPYPGLRKPKDSLSMADLFMRQELLFEALHSLSQDFKHTNPAIEAMCIGFDRTPWIEDSRK